MELKDYSTEDLKAELKRRSDLAKAEKSKVKRCRMCKHWGKITYWGEDLSSEKYECLKRFNCSKCCIFSRLRMAKIIAATVHINVLASILKKGRKHHDKRRSKRTAANHSGMGRR